VFRREPFRDVIRRQLEIFQRDEAELIRDTEEAERAYNRAPREEAEAYYEKYADLVETGTEALAALRDAYVRTLDEDTAEEYEAAFNRAVRKRLPPFALEIRDT
jgi:hypothetical protein